MTVTAKLLYSLATIGMLIFLANCDECDDPAAKASYYYCSNGVPYFTNGETHEKVMGAEAKLYDCTRNPNGSPLWANSGQPVNPPTPVAGVNSFFKARAVPGTTTAYIPKQVLDLPFLPLPYLSSPGSTTCDSSSPDVLQVNHDNALVTRVSTCPFAIKKAIPVVSRPLQIAITPDGQMALVTSFDNAINFIDLSSNTVVFTLMTSFNPHGIAITSDGSTAYVSSFDDAFPLIATIDIAARRVTRTITTSAYPQSVFLTPDDTQLYIVFPFGNTMTIMDTLTGVIGNAFSINTPRAVAFNSIGTKAFITSAYPGTVLQLDTETFQIEKTYTVGNGPTEIAVLYGDAIVVVMNYEGQSTSRIDLRSGLVTTLALGGPPVGLSIVR